MPDRKTAVVPCASCGKLNRVDLARAADRPRCGSCRTPIPLDRPIHVTDASFQKVVGGASVPVLVDFHADWCGPCKMVAPILDQIARDRAGRLLVAKLDTDANPRTAQRFRVASLPTMMVFRGGEVAQQAIGALPRPGIERLLEQAGA